jgi:hypothetical protein
VSRLRAAFVLAGAAALQGCAAQTVRYEPTESPSVRLQTRDLPRLLLEDVADQVGRGELRGPAVPDTQVVWADVAREALTTELSRLGWPLAQSRSFAGARLKATVTKAEAIWSGGFGVRVDGKVRIGLVLKEPQGREIWEGELIGAGVGTAGGGGVPANGIREAWRNALAEAMSRLGPLLDAERPWTLLGKEPGAAQVRAEAPRPSTSPDIRSDVDELPRAGARRKAYAVVIGIERYRERLPNADFSADDAKLAAQYFERVLGVPEQNLVLMTNERATKGDFEKYFERWLPNRVEAGDDVYVYYSGHGAPNPAKGDAYLVPYDGDPAYIDQTGFAIKRLFDDLAKLPAKQVYVAMDSCFSGAGGRSVIAKGARPLVAVVQSAVPANVTVLAASASDQISNSYQEKGHGLFTYYLLKGLKEKGGNLRAAFDYLKPEVARVARREYNTDQDPQWSQGR